MEMEKRSKEAILKDIPATQMDFAYIARQKEIKMLCNEALPMLRKLLGNNSGCGPNIETKYSKAIEHVRGCPECKASILDIIQRRVVDEKPTTYDVAGFEETIAKAEKRLVEVKADGRKKRLY